MLPSTPAAAAQELSALNTCNTCATVELWSLRGHLCPRGAAGGIERVNDGRPGDPGRPPGLPDLSLSRRRWCPQSHLTRGAIAGLSPARAVATALAQVEVRDCNTGGGGLRSGADQPELAGLVPGPAEPECAHGQVPGPAPGSLPPLLAASSEPSPLLAALESSASMSPA